LIKGGKASRRVCGKKRLSEGGRGIPAKAKEASSHFFNTRGNTKKSLRYGGRRDKSGFTIAVAKPSGAGSQGGKKSGVDKNRERRPAERDKRGKNELGRTWEVAVTGEKSFPPTSNE